jgi:hypothetical protein
MKRKSDNEPLLSASTGTLSTELLGLHPAGVCNQESPVVRDELLLELECACGIVVLGVVRNNGLCDCLSDCVDLGSVTTTLYADTDVDGCKGVFADDEDGLVDLEAEDFGLEESDR